MSTDPGPHDQPLPGERPEQAPREQVTPEQPTYGQPSYGQPSYGQTSYGQPSYGQQQPGDAPHGQRPSGQPLTGTVEMAPEQQRLWAMLAHLSPFAAGLLGIATGGTVYLGALAPLVIFLVLKDRGVFVRRQAAEALNLQILFTVIYLVGVVLGLVTLGIGFLAVVPLLALVGITIAVFQVIGAVKANQGIDYRYPLNWRLVR